MKRILMFYPTHRTAVNSIAELFPDISFEMVVVPEVLRTCPILGTDNELYPFEPNVKVLDLKWNEVDEYYYNCYIITQHVAPFVTRKWNIPGISLALNVGEPPFRGCNWNVANTFSAYAQLPSNKTLIVPTVGKKSVGSWVGSERMAYFINKNSFIERIGVSWNPEFMLYLKSKVPFSMVPDLLPRKEYLDYRRKQTVYVELSNRVISCMLCESMMMGQPVVAPNMHDYNYLIDNGKTGFLYESMEQAKSQINYLIENRVLAEDIGRGAFFRAEKLFGDDVRRSRWTEVFDKVMK